MSDAGGFSLLVSFIDPTILSRVVHRCGRSEMSTHSGIRPGRGWYRNMFGPAFGRPFTRASATTEHPLQSKGRGPVAQHVMGLQSAGAPPRDSALGCCVTDVRNDALMAPARFRTH